ncbi:extracellular solute-binding protein [Marinospirillum perlucidum]|uniref:extracellular solute-binding protein n=1 Tax=Marinospirillum perlucidum TaxID=1982602 RepID=UPI000DF16FA6|nr:extracellular solute-binding protein [Marinospirillum perlucidum]
MPASRFFTDRLNRLTCITSLAGLLAFAPLTLAAETACQPALSLYGEPKYGEDFQHFDYVNPSAPTGGQLRQAALGTFDSLNPFIIQGTPATGLGHLYDSLTYHSADEPFTEYGLLAECMRLDPEGEWIEFQLREEARFQDGEAVTAEDVVFTFNLLREKGQPFYRAYYADITAIEAVSSQRVRFQLATADNRELPLIIGQVPILPQHYWAERDFTQPSLEVPLGSGPYQLTEVDAGRRLVYTRDDNYWGRDLPVNRGRNNIGQHVYEYFRDATVALEAFKAGRLDYRQENIARNWAEAYEGPALEQGKIQLVSLEHENSTGMQGFFFNTRREIFADPRVRLGLTQLFDFEWTNQQLFHGAYTRTESYFSNSELASRGLPEGRELEILDHYRDQLPQEVFTREYDLPETDGSGSIRPQMRKALSLFREAGWQLDGRRLVNDQGIQMEFEILLHNASFERIVLPWKRNLERLGIQMNLRLVDVTQYLNRLRDFDYDLVVSTLGQSLSPGNEQREYFHSDFAQASDGRNLSGIEDPVVDALVEKLIAAPTREELVQTTRALDRVLLWGHYVLPHWHIDEYRVAKRAKVRLPEVNPPYSLATDTWWIEED